MTRFDLSRYADAVLFLNFHSNGYRAARRSFNARVSVGIGGEQPGVQREADAEAAPVSWWQQQLARLCVAERNLAADRLRRVLSDYQQKDPENYQHGFRVGMYSALIGAALGFDDDRLSFLAVAAWLHDLGKIHIPRKIHKKRARLDQEEFLVMQEHVIPGFQLLTAVGGAAYARVALCHHERYDGTGYPHGLGPNVLCSESQITSCADAYDAITVYRCYREGAPHELAMDELLENAGRQFNPVVAETCHRIAGEIDALRVALRDGLVTDGQIVARLTGRAKGAV